MPAVLPLFACVLASVLIHRHGRPALTKRDALLVGVTLSAAWLVLGTELLSVVRAIRFWPVFFWWLAPTVAMCIVSLRGMSNWRELIPSWPALKFVHHLLLVPIVFLLGWSLCQAIVSPPNNVDSQE